MKGMVEARDEENWRIATLLSLAVPYQYEHPPHQPTLHHP